MVCEGLPAARATPESIPCDCFEPSAGQNSEVSFTPSWGVSAYSASHISFSSSISVFSVLHCEQKLHASVPSECLLGLYLKLNIPVQSGL